MAYGSKDHYKPDAQLLSLITGLNTSIERLTAIFNGLITGSDLLNKLDALDGTMDGKLDVTQLSAVQAELLAKLTGIDTSLLTGGDLLNKLDALDGTVDGKLDLAELNSAQCEVLNKLTGLDTGINIEGQSLGQLINRPKYGAAQRGEMSGTAVANETTRFLTLSGKGIIYGGFLAVQGAGIQKTDVPYIYIDGSEAFGQSFEYLNYYGLSFEHSAMYFLRCYDNTNYVYSVGLGFGYTFESLVEIYYEENNGRTPAVTGSLHYALI